jgi:hypothetical protein
MIRAVIVRSIKTTRRANARETDRSDNRQPQDNLGRASLHHARHLSGASILVAKIKMHAPTNPATR